MNKCNSCAGEGIVGAGDFPLARQGVITTCKNCSGTGKTPDEVKVVEKEEVKEDVPVEPAPVADEVKVE